MTTSAKAQIDVSIGGKTFKLAASESPDYIKQVADYIDKKLKQLNVTAGSDIMKNEYFSIILALNIADDLFKSNNENSQKIADLVDQIETILNSDPPAPEQIKELAESKKQMTELKTQLNAKLNDYELLLNQFQQKNSEVDSLKDTIYKQEDTINSLNTKIEDLTEENTEQKKITASKSQYIIDLTKKISDKNLELNNLSKKLAEKNTSLNELNKKSAERNIKLNNVNKERDELAVKLKAANANIRSLNKEIESNNREHNIKLKELHKKHDKLNHNYKALTEDNNSLKKEYDKFTESLENSTDGQLKAAFAKIKAENIELRRTIEDLRIESAENN